jgi:hypothetical protein
MDWQQPTAADRRTTRGTGETVTAKKPARSGQSGKAPENDTQRRMREALEAKQARNKAAHGEDHLGGHGVSSSNNDVTKRQFRRKSGSS